MVTKKKNAPPIEVVESTPEPEATPPTPEPEPAVVAPPAPVVPEPVVEASGEASDIVSEVLALQQKLQEQKQKAIDTLLAQRNAIEQKLTSLGYDLAPATVMARRAPIARTGGASSAPTTTAAANNSPFCRYCNVAGHDARSHRGQKVKAPFSPEQLKELTK